MDEPSWCPFESTSEAKALHDDFLADTGRVPEPLLGLPKAGAAVPFLAER